jgi:hypothetical protein
MIKCEETRKCLIVPGDLPDDENAKKLASGLIVPSDLPDRENARKLASGLIVPGDLPDDKMRGNSQVV